MSCSSLHDTLQKIVLSNQCYVNSWLSQQVSKTLRLRESSNISYALLNLIMYHQTQTKLVFIPCGVKCTNPMLDEFVFALWGCGIDSLQSEIKVQYNSTYYSNLLRQFPFVFEKFQFDERKAKMQSYIYGYFVWTTEPVENPFREVSHCFTNKNTIETMSCVIDMTADMDPRILEKLRGVSEICVTGSIVMSLMGIKCKGQPSYEFVTYDPIHENDIMTTVLRENMSPFTDMVMLLNCEKESTILCRGGKIKWGQECLMVPRQTIIIQESPLHEVLCPVDLLHQESLLIYYKGVKFLCMSPEITPLLATSPPSINSFLNDAPLVKLYRCESPSPNKIHQNMNQSLCKDKISRVYQMQRENVSVFQNCFLHDHSSKDNSLWVLRTNGSFDVVKGNSFFFPWILTSKFVSFGTIFRNGNILVMTYSGSKQNFKLTRECVHINLQKAPELRVNILCNEGLPRRNSSLSLKKILPNIQDERKKRNTISVLSTLLQGNGR